jgi:hypothetical protein
MMIRVIILILFASVAAAFGQGAHYTYPFSVGCPDEIVVAGQSVTIAAKFEDGKTGELYIPSYNWSVSQGIISSGQGTPSITIEIGRENVGQVIVTLDRVFNEAHFPGVQQSANCTVAIAPLPQARMVDEFRTAGSNCEEGFARLDAFFTEISSNPADEALIVLYGDIADAGAARRREKQLRNHFRFRNFDRSRIRFYVGGPRPNGTTQFWLVPPGADQPEIAGATAVTGIVERPTQTFLYATQYADGIPGCFGNIYDLGEYAEVIKTDPENIARIVIGQSSQARYRIKAKEIADELRRYGIPSNRIVTIYKYVRPNRLLEMTELWVVPPNPRPAISGNFVEMPEWTHRCPQGGLASIFRC